MTLKHIWYRRVPFRAFQYFSKPFYYTYYTFQDSFLTWSSRKYSVDFGAIFTFHTFWYSSSVGFWICSHSAIGRSLNEPANPCPCFTWIFRNVSDSVISSTKPIFKRNAHYKTYCKLHSLSCSELQKRNTWFRGARVPRMGPAGHGGSDIVSRGSPLELSHRWSFNSGGGGNTLANNIWPSWDRWPHSWGTEAPEPSIAFLLEGSV